MSESVSYNTKAVVGGAGSSILDALRRRGISLENNREWAMAKERATQLQELVSQELDKHCSLSLQEMTGAELELARTEAMLKGFSSIPAFLEYAEQVHAGEWDNIIQDTTRIKGTTSIVSENELLSASRQIQDRLEAVAAATQKALCDVEKTVLQDQVSMALNNLGYRVEQNNEAIKATRGQSCIWMETNCWGEISMDYSGFSGLSCLNESKRVEEQFRKQGLIIQRTASDCHGRPEGGVLTRKLESMFPVFRKFDWGDNIQNQSQKQTIK